MEKRRNISILTFILATTLVTAGLVFWSSFRIKESTPLKESFASSTLEQITQSETKEDVLSPNGKMTLTVKNVRKTDIISQIFFTTTDTNETPVQIYSADSSSGRTILIPYNTFSPDNKYVFLKTGTSDKPEYLVLRTDGKNIQDDDKGVEITKLFYEKYPELIITDVTGWGGIGLIVVNADYKEGKVGPSFWFDLSNFSFIKLSTRFN